MAVRRLIQTTENLQQRRLAGTRCTDNREPLAGVDRDIHRLQHIQRDWPLPETPLNVARFEYGFSHVAKPRQEQCVTPATQDKG